MKNELVIILLFTMSFYTYSNDYQTIVIQNTSQENLYIYYSSHPPGRRIQEARENLKENQIQKRTLLKAQQQKCLKISNLVASIFAATESRHFRRKTKTSSPCDYLITKTFYGKPRLKPLEDTPIR